MRAPIRLAIPALLAAALGGCGLLGGGKAPAHLYTLTPSAEQTASLQRSANAGETVTIEVPVAPEELRAVRVPVQEGPTTIAYVKDLTWVDTPGNLLQDLIAETVRRTTSRVVLDPKQSTLDPGLTVSGELRKFGFDAQTGQATVVYDAALSTAGGTRVETRRFTGSSPADGTAATVAPALNQAANQVALDVAKWIAG